MADIQVDALMATYEAEIGRLTGELIRQRLAFQAEMAELQQRLDTDTDPPARAPA